MAERSDFLNRLIFQGSILPLEIHSSPPRLGGGSVSRRPVFFLGGFSPLPVRTLLRKRWSLRRFGGYCSPGSRRLRVPSKPPAALLPSQKRVMSLAFGLRSECRVSIPGPRGRGPGLQNAGRNAAPVGRRLRTGGVSSGLRGCFPCPCRANIQEVGRGFFRFRRRLVSGLSMVLTMLVAKASAR